MTIDIILVALAFIFIILGMVGSFMPVLPGPPLAYMGFILVYFSGYHPFSSSTMWVYGVLVVLISVVDYFLPMWATQLSGGTSSGARGALIGTLLGMFVPLPLGIFIGAFVGAYMGELSAGKNQRQALIAATASFMGFVAGSLLKFLFCLFMGIHLMISLIW